MSSLNKVSLIGNLGADPDVRAMQDGREVCNLSVATSERWKDKNTGEQKEVTEWHRVVIFSQGLVGIAKRYLKKGSKVYVEGKLQTRKWTDQNGTERYTTEVVMTGFDAKLVLLSPADGSGFGSGRSSQADDFNQGFERGQQQDFAIAGTSQYDDLDDQIPF